jgi:hypothetical protein
VTSSQLHHFFHLLHDVIAIALLPVSSFHDVIAIALLQRLLHFMTSLTIAFTYHHDVITVALQLYYRCRWPHDVIAVATQKNKKIKNKK